MSDTTTKWGITKPLGTDDANVPLYIRGLADFVDANITAWSSGTLATRPTSTPASPGKSGRLYMVTDQNNRIDYDTGTSWVTIKQDPAEVTSLPSSPVDGQETLLVGTVLGKRFAWRARYSSMTTKWDVIGGRPLLSETTNINIAANSTTTVATLTPPVTGTYIVRATCEVNQIATMRIRKTTAPSTDQKNATSAGQGVLSAATELTSDGGGFTMLITMGPTVGLMFTNSFEIEPVYLG